MHKLQNSNGFFEVFEPLVFQMCQVSRCNKVSGLLIGFKKLT